MTYDDPFIVQMNIDRLRLLLHSGNNEATQRMVRSLLVEFEALSTCKGRHAPNGDMAGNVGDGTGPLN